MHPSFLWAQGPRKSSCSLQGRSYAARVRTAVWTSLTQSQSMKPRQSSVGFQHSHIHICLSLHNSSGQPGATCLAQLPEGPELFGWVTREPKLQVTLLFVRSSTRKFFRMMVIRGTERNHAILIFQRSLCAKATVLEKLPKWFTFFSKKLILKMITGGQIFSLSANLKLGGFLLKAVILNFN